MSTYGRMILATVIFIITIAVTFITYSVVVIPLEYTTDTLQDAYTDISDDMGWDDTEAVNNGIGSMVYFLAGAVVFYIILMVVWLFAMAHKKEYEQG